MENLLLDILAHVRGSAAAAGGVADPGDTESPAPRALEARELARIIRAHNEGRGGLEAAPFAKKQLLPFYRRVKHEEPDRWRSWNVDEQLEEALVATLRMKPGRTASGVATITVLTKPWPCGGSCLYCPNDVRMPKSYLADEPACQRAERSLFDPYLQVAARLATLEDMGHVTDKVELIVLGGTWDDYPRDYQTWFVCGLFAALNADEAARRDEASRRRAHLSALGLSGEPEAAAAFAAEAQRAVNAGLTSYNDAVRRLYGESPAWRALAAEQRADDEELSALQRANETARRRCVGLVVETRPDAVSAESLTRARRLGCTKIQMGIQSLDGRVLGLNDRASGEDAVACAFELLRLFGFKTHVHAMVNLRGSTPEADMRDYRRLVEDAAFMPDEVKLYPCVLVEGAQLEEHFAGDTDEPARCADGAAGEEAPWRPYPPDTLAQVLAADVVATPPWTRISRMVRDISSGDVVAGNRTTNLREDVEARLKADGAPVREMRLREVRGSEVDPESLTLSVLDYPTTVSREYFLQWVTPEDRLAGFARLSLPDERAVRAHLDELPVGPGEAMIREVHVYGRVAALDAEGQNAQHRGLGRRLVERACDIARDAGYTAVNVISAVGTREYYRRLGFTDAGLYQRKEL